MAYFVIAGKPDCPHYVHAAYVANYMKERLPNFDLQTIQLRTGDWEPWLEDINKKNHWFHTKSPLIWKTLVLRGGKPHLIGGLSEFWEYCCDYYSLESIIPKDELNKLVEDNMMFFEEMEQSEEERRRNVRIISITGAAEPILVHLLPELLKLPELQLSSGIIVRLFDNNYDDPKKMKFLENLIKESPAISTDGNVEYVTIVEYLTDAIMDCDILIVLDDFAQKEDEDIHDCMIRNTYNVFFMADKINAFAKRQMKIILAHPGMICFSGSLLMDSCTRIRISNIVGISSDLGLSVLSVLSDHIGVPIEELSAPPVWGFIGTNEFIDIENIIQCSDIYKPYLRAIRTNGGSTLPLGTIKSELRKLVYLINDPEKILEDAKINKKLTAKSLERQPILAKVRSIISLLKLWYSKDIPDDIISLAICSNGSFGIPSGLIFSQPAILDSRRIWIPFKNFPITDKVNKKIAEFVPKVLKILDRFATNPNSLSRIKI